MRIITKILFATLVALCSVFAVRADDDVVPIRIVCPSEGGEVIHRSPEEIPITCLLLSDAIVVNFLNNLGSVIIEIENQTSGEYSQSVVNALAGPMLLPISGTSGYWTILFTLPSGVQYFGEFTIN